MRTLKIILCGYGPLGLGLLKSLLDAHKEGHCEIVGVFRWSDALRCKTGQHFPEWCLEPSEALFAKLCTQHHIHRFHGNGLNSYAFMTELLRLKPDVVLVGSWGEKLKSHLLSGPKPLFVNCHPSLLPAHRGPNPYASVILAREAETGVTFHRITESIDTGPILLQNKLPILPYDDGHLLRERCAQLAQDLLPELLDKVRPYCQDERPLEEILQNECLASYFKAPSQKDAEVDWQLEPEDISRILRARYPWSMGYQRILNNMLRINLGAATLKYETSPVNSTIPGKILALTPEGLKISSTVSSKTLFIKDFYLSIGSLRLPKPLSSAFLRLLTLFTPSGF